MKKKKETGLRDATVYQTLIQKKKSFKGQFVLQ